MGEHIRIVPVIALRGMTVLPNSTRFFDISRPKSIAALEAAMMADQKLFLVGQRSPDVADPSMEELWGTGTIAEVRQLIKLPGGVIRVMVEGKERARLLELAPSDSMLTGDVMEAPVERDMPDAMARDAMMRVLKDKLTEYGEGNPKMARDKLPACLLRLDYAGVLNFFDAIGLGVFSVSGVNVALNGGFADNPLLSITVGVLTGIGGGMVRDLLNGEIPSVLRKNVYALAAILGAGAYYLLAHSALPALASVLLACLLTIGLRLAATYFRWHLPRPNPRG